MSPPPTDWNDVALHKLTHVLGGKAGRDLMAETLEVIGVTRLGTADELSRFARALVTKGGFAGAIGAMLSLHATMYETGEPRRNVEHK